MSTTFERLLCAINKEYADKFDSCRLDLQWLIRVAYDDDVAAALKPRADGREGTAQRAGDFPFKLLPSLRHIWEEWALLP